jgi:platelet-activating factor acetylhydrolase IB subunit beta/gamma
LRDRNEEVNKLVHSKVSAVPKCETVVIDKGFIQPDGTISHHDMHDYLHLTNSGYYKAFEPVYELLTQLLTEEETEKDLTLSE